jgi:hypothetical protein
MRAGSAVGFTDLQGHLHLVYLLAEEVFREVPTRLEAFAFVEASRGGVRALDAERDLRGRRKPGDAGFEQARPDPASLRLRQNVDRRELHLVWRHRVKVGEPHDLPVRDAHEEDPFAYSPLERRLRVRFIDELGSYLFGDDLAVGVVRAPQAPSS